TSYSRMQNLKIIEKDSGDSELVLLQIVTTCWLLFSNVVKNLHQIINSVVEALLEDTNYISLFDIKLQLNATIYAITIEFIGEKNDFAKAIIESLKERFPNHALIDSFHILDPKELPIDKSILGSYGQDFIQKLIEFYG
ncbi:29509_t:CDS:2, partial [Gigaspora margarita]